MNVSKIFLAAVVSLAVTELCAQGPMMTVMSKNKGAATAENLVGSIVTCKVAARSVPVRLNDKIIMSNVKFFRESRENRNVVVQTMRFNVPVSQVIPVLQSMSGGKIRLEPFGDLRRLPIGAVWHGFNEEEGMESTHDFICTRVEK